MKKRGVGFICFRVVKNVYVFVQLTHEEEEAERRELQKLLSDDKPGKETVSETSLVHKPAMEKPVSFTEQICTVVLFMFLSFRRSMGKLSTDFKIDA